MKKILRYVFAVILCAIVFLSVPVLLAFILPSNLTFISTPLCFIWGLLNGGIFWKAIWNYVTE